MDQESPELDLQHHIPEQLCLLIFGGEGIFLATLRGTGKVWLQFMPIRKLVKAIAPRGENRAKVSVLSLESFLKDN